jgi:hypothetical protein
VSAIQTLKAMAIEPQMQRRWEEQLAGYIGSSFDVLSLGNWTSQAVQFISKIVTALTLYFGAYLVIEGQLTVGELIAFNMLAGRVAQPVAPGATVAGLPSGEGDLSLLHLLLGNFEAGWLGREARWKSQVRLASCPNFSEPRWLGAESIEGKTILIYADEGFGDSIQFAAKFKVSRCVFVTTRNSPNDLPNFFKKRILPHSVVQHLMRKLATCPFRDRNV